MTSTENQSPARTPGSTSAGTDQASAPGSGGAAGATVESNTGRGTTTVAPVVVGKVAGLAVREVPGVYSVGSGVSRAFGAVRQRIAGTRASTPSSGVQVEVGQRQAAVDLDLVVEWGYSAIEVARQVRRSVREAIERTTGLEVVEVNIAVNDLHFSTPEEQDGDRDRAPEPAPEPLPSGRVQ